jgi:SRSO17 transposase
MMIPECRQNDYWYAIPKFAVTEKQVEHFVEELKVFHAKFAECFARSEPRENVFQDLRGRLSSLARKTIEPMAVNVKGKRAVRAMQRCIRDAVWDEARAVAIYHGMVAEELGDPEGVLSFDESGFVKKGEYSAGVARQYCGTLGKVDNCQVGVFAGYASRHEYTLVDRRLYFPEQWFEEEYAAKRQQWEVPAELEFQTKPQLAAEMLVAIYQQGTLPFTYIVADTVYGKSVACIEAAEHCGGKTYLVSMPADTLCWLQPPRMTTKTYWYQGERRSRRVLKEPEPAPLSFEQFARQWHPHFWDKRTVAEGTKGPIEDEFARRQVVLAKGGLLWKQVWLMIKRTIGEHPTYRYYVSNASMSPRLRTFVWLSGMRWAIEQCFEEANQEVGMDHDEVRKYPGWHHHMFTCILAHFFLWHLKLLMGEKSTLFDRPSGEVASQNGLAFEDVFNRSDARPCAMDSTEESPGVSFSQKEETPDS